MECNDPFRKAYEIYEFLRDNNIPQSGTSQLLQKPDFSTFTLKAIEELNELVDAAEGEHTHFGNNQRKDIILEGHEVWYWLSLACVSHGIPYDSIQSGPWATCIYNELKKGELFLEDIDIYKLEIIEGIDLSVNKNASCTMLLSTGLISAVCDVISKKKVSDIVPAYKEVLPNEIAEYDLKEMADAKKKPYLKHFFPECDEAQMR